MKWVPKISTVLDGIINSKEQAEKRWICMIVIDDELKRWLLEIQKFDLSLYPEKQYGCWGHYIEILVRIRKPADYNNYSMVIVEKITIFIQKSLLIQSGEQWILKKARYGSDLPDREIEIERIKL